jgi:hypothetical protein
MTSWLAFCEHFESFCQPSRDGNSLVRGRPYDGATAFVAYQFDVKADKWSRKNGRLLRDHVARLNKMVDAIRADLDPEYRQREGYFAIPDVPIGKYREAVGVLVPHLTTEEVKALSGQRISRSPKHRTAARHGSGA